MANTNQDVIRVSSTEAGATALRPGMIGLTTDTDKISYKKFSDSSLRYISDDTKQGLLATAQSFTGAKTFTVTADFTASTSITTTGSVVIGATSGDGTLHVHTATAGSVTANTSADDLVVENSGTGGISVLVPDANDANVFFGSPTDEKGAIIRWNHDADLMKIGTSNPSAELAFYTGDFVEAARIDSSGNVGIGTASPAKLVDIVGTSATTLEAIQLTNDDWGTGETTQTVDINFKLSVGGASVDDAARITVGKDDDWDDAAASDSHMSFKTNLSGTLTERMRINSDGIVDIKSGKLKLIGTGGPQQDYLMHGEGNVLNFISQDAATGFVAKMKSLDADATDNVFLQLTGYLSGSDEEYLQLGWDLNEAAYIMNSVELGSGTLRPIKIQIAGLSAITVDTSRNINIPDLTASLMVATDGSKNLVSVAKSSAYTPTNVSTDRAFDADTVAISELADIVGTLISDLQTANILS